MLPHLAHALRRLEVADQQLEQRRLARAVCAEHDDARAERHGDARGRDDGALAPLVRKVDVLHRHHRLAVGADPLRLARVGEADRQDRARRDELLDVGQGGEGGAGAALRAALVGRLGAVSPRDEPARPRVDVPRPVVRRAGGLPAGGQAGRNLGPELLELAECHRVVDEAARLAELAAVVVVGDVGAHLVDEVVVVRDDAHRDARE
mmetsp:Transcript_23872/g.71034  ORF Transcript_23872/g.71034 Transcript_23872/m.71034 type:complete len:207 (+) Transcript_23872:1049-1669(+)